MTFQLFQLSNVWTDTDTAGFAATNVYVVQTITKVVRTLHSDDHRSRRSRARSDLRFGHHRLCRRAMGPSLDHHRHQSRVALALARTRLMGARYPYYLLADSREGRAKEAELTQRASGRHANSWRHSPGLRLRARAAHHAEVDRQQSEIDDIWEKWQATLEPLRDGAERRARQEVLGGMGNSARGATAELRPTATPRSIRTPTWWEARIARQKEIDASIASARRCRISLRPALRRQCPRPRRRAVHGRKPVAAPRACRPSEEELLDDIDAAEGKRSPRRRATRAPTDFAAMVLDNLRTAGVHQAASKGDRISFTSLHRLAGRISSAPRARFIEGENGPERRAAHPDRPGIRHRLPRRSCRRRARGDRRALRRADRLRLQFRRPFLRADQARPPADPEGHDEPRPAHGGRTEEHRAAATCSSCSASPTSTSSTTADRKSACKVNGVDVFDPNTGDIRSNDTDGHRRLVHRHRLQRGELLRPPRLFPRRATIPTRA